MALTPRPEATAEQATLEFTIRRQLNAYKMTRSQDGQTEKVYIPEMNKELMEFVENVCLDIGQWRYDSGVFEVASEADHGTGILRYRYTIAKIIHNKVQMIAKQSTYVIQGDHDIERDIPEDLKLAVAECIASTKAPAVQTRPEVYRSVPSNPLQVISAECGGFPSQQLESPFEPPRYDPQSQLPPIPEEDSPSEFGALMNIGLLEAMLPKKG